MINSKNTTALFDNKEFWEQIYQNRSLLASGWYQPIPASSLNLIADSNISKSDSIIDVGGGDSLLVDHLLDQGYKNITVLDISKTAIDKAKKRLGTRAENVKWICTDITKFESNLTFDLWHDRACLHFLNNDHELKLYKEKLEKNVSTGGNLILGAFSKTGPKKCSGLTVHQYNLDELANFFPRRFESYKKFESVHLTPSNASQNYVFCRFKKK